jgi:hypothetical protein
VRETRVFAGYELQFFVLNCLTIAWINIFLPCLCLEQWAALRNTYSHTASCCWTSLWIQNFCKNM